MNTPSRVLISGASGFIGTALVRVFTVNQISVNRLVRKPKPDSPQEICLSPSSSPAIATPSELENYDAVIHLSGANVAHRWTPAYKKKIVESRVRTTAALVRLLAGLRNPPKVFLCASAVGIYGNRDDEILTEATAPGTGFLAETCIAWEAAAQPAKNAGIRTAQLRFGVVLSPKDGALAKMLPLFRSGLGGRLSSGRQWMSWITLPDLLRAVLYLVTASEVSGPVNIVAPTPVTNAEFARTLARALHRPAILPVPAFALRAIFGEMADETLLSSIRVIPEKLTQAGFRFQHPDLAPALESILAKSI